MPFRQAALRFWSHHANMTHVIRPAGITVLPITPENGNFLWERQHIGAHLSLPVQLTIRRNVLASVVSLNVYCWWLTESSHY